MLNNINVLRDVRFPILSRREVKSLLDNINVLSDVKVPILLGREGREVIVL